MQDEDNVQALQSQLNNAMKLISELQRAKSSNSLGESPSPTQAAAKPKANPKLKGATATPSPKVTAAKAKPAAKSTPSPSPQPAVSADDEKALLALGFFHLDFKFGKVFQSKRIWQQ